MIKFNKNSLAFRINLIGLVLVALLFLFFGTNLYLTGQSMQRLEKAKVLSSVKSQLSTLQEALFSNVQEQVEKIIHRLLEQKAVEKIVLVKEGVKNIYTPSDFKNLPEQGEKFTKMIPLFHGDRLVGNLIVYYRTVYAAQFYDRYVSRLFIALLIMLIFILLTNYFINHNMKLLTRFARQLRRLDPMEVKQVKPKNDFFEFVTIADAINKMLKRIHDYAENLNELNKKLKENERKLIRAHRIAQIISWSYYPDSKKIDVTYEFFRLFEIKKRQAQTLNLKEVFRYIHPEDRPLFLQTLDEAIRYGKKFEFIHKVVTSRGKLRYMRTEGRVSKAENKPTEVIGISMDVTEEVEAKRQADFMALYDPLTGLLNRRSLKEKLDSLLHTLEPSEKKVALLFIDLDNFKMINDSYGHEIGDRLLRRISDILKDAVREFDIVARIGGDEFVIVFNDVLNRKIVETLAEKILAKVAGNHWIEARQFTVTTSIGAALFPDDAQDADTLIRYADTAMYEAKRSGKNRVLFFNDEIRRKIEERRDLVEDLKKALNVENQITLYFQPQIDLQNGSVIGAEILTRWHHPTRGLLFPNEYIPLIEGSEMMNQYDDYVIEMAFRQLQKWNDRFDDKWRVGINLSAGQFSTPRLIENLKKNIRKYTVDPSRIDLEITESLPMQDVTSAIEMLENIKALGFSVSIDDFGTGYSSLSYLQRLPFDVIKIDREFIKDLHWNRDSRVIVGLMIQMGKTLGKKTIAEGLDTKEHIAILKELGCDYAQGFYYSKAVSEEAFVEFAVKSAKT